MAMAADPGLVYAGPESRSIDVTAILYGGGAIVARGVIGNFDTSAGDAGAPFADAGPLAWIAFDGDPSQIEFVQYVEAGTGRTLHRRVTKRERVSAIWNTCKLHLATDATVIAAAADFDELHFSPTDFNTRRVRDDKAVTK